MNDFIETLPQLAAEYGLKVLGAIAVFVIGRWLISLLMQAFYKTMHHSRVDQTLTKFLGNVLRYILLAILIVIALTQLGIPTTTMVAVLGGLTLAVGLALQDSLGNLAAGIMIILLRPYKLYDVVDVNGQMGEVTDIKIFHTQLTTLQNKVIYIPNNEVISSNIENYTQKGTYRLDMPFGIGYGANIRQAKEILLDIVKSNEHILAEPEPSVIVSELADSSVNLVVRGWIHFKDNPGVQAYVTEQVKLRFDQAGISIPFPQRDVHLFQAN